MTNKYDVAISFVAADEPLALQLREALAPLSVFVYSKAQEELAGRDGVDAFREVFRETARLTVVLFRAKWGQTPWTRVEETAIKDHCLAEGWPHLFFVKLEHAEKPKWVPDSNLYLDFQSFGLGDLVGAIKARCAELGVALRPLTAGEKAKQIANAEKLQAETTFKIRNAPNVVYDAASAVFDGIERRLAEIDQNTDWAIVRSRDKTRGFGAFTVPISVVLNTRWSGDGEGTVDVRLFDGRAQLPGENGVFLTFERPHVVKHLTLHLTRSADLAWCWKFEKRLLSSEQAAEMITEEFVKARERHPPE